MPPNNPHFDLPFRLGAERTLVMVEQDTYEDVANCVETIVRTPLGYRSEVPEFGFPAVEFELQPILTESVLELVISQEPRAVLMIEENPDVLDELIDHITVNV